MAEAAQAKNCPTCGTLTTCVGDYDSHTLVGKCPSCGRGVEMPHLVVEKHPVYGQQFVRQGTPPAPILPEPTTANVTAPVVAEPQVSEEPDGGTKA